jgi:DNA adenine methylase
VQRQETPLPARPLLKWAGGKRQLLAVLAEHYPARFSRYLEPFVGSGAVFFDLMNQGRLDACQILLADVNPDLVGCYRTLRDHVEDVIRALASLEREHRLKGEACYYAVRDERFNPRRAALMNGGSEALASSYTPSLAAMLIYLNRTGFNGLFRLNRHGGFNVPAGRYTDPRICDAANLRAVAAALARPGLGIELSGFEATLAGARAGDFVYCDPPYAPLSRTASFAQYTAEGFSALDQQRLHRAVMTACARGAYVVLSNSSAPAIARAYGSTDARRVGLNVRRVSARRAINSRASSRGPVDELIISNVARRALDDIRPRMASATLKRATPTRMARSSGRASSSW